MPRKRKKDRDLAPPPSTSAPRVLVVNDDEDACELVCRLLARAGYEVDRAYDQDQALVQLRAEPPHCVVLDQVTGAIGQNLATLDKIRSHPDARIAQTRVLLVTEQANHQMFAWQAGIDAFMSRPFFADDLLREVAIAIEVPDDERSRNRRRRLDAAAAAGGG